MYDGSKLNKKLDHQHIFFSYSYLQKVDKDNPQPPPPFPPRSDTHMLHFFYFGVLIFCKILQITRVKYCVQYIDIL